MPQDLVEKANGQSTGQSIIGGDEVNLTQTMNPGFSPSTTLELTATAKPTKKTKNPKRTPPPPTRTPLPNTIGPEGFDSNVNPLTGLVVDNLSLLNRRPIGIKINNYPRSNRPQWGLSLADIVYEFYHNNDLTRFHAIFYGNDASMIGPIRSARLFDRFLVSVYESIFVFASADERVLDILLSKDFTNRLVYTTYGGRCPPAPVCRYKPETYNYLISSTKAIHEYAARTGIDDAKPYLYGMVFSPSIPLDGVEVTRLFIRYSYSAYLYWEYDPGTEQYYRYQDNQDDFSGQGEAYRLLKDRLTGEPITAKNVIVLVVSHEHRVYVPPQDGLPATEIVEIDFDGTGRAYALRDGMLYKLEWVRKVRDEQVHLIYPDGSRFPYKPGNTWFQVINENPSVQKNGAIWRFTFNFEPPEVEEQDE
jgi:hypothetical protein